MIDRKDGIISRYEYDESRKVELKILKFDSYSEAYQLIRDGVSDMHCMSDAYLAEELEQEYAEKKQLEKGGF